MNMITNNETIISKIREKLSDVILVENNSLFEGEIIELLKKIENHDKQITRELFHIATDLRRMNLTQAYNEVKDIVMVESAGHTDKLSKEAIESWMKVSAKIDADMDAAFIEFDEMMERRRNERANKK